MISAYLLILLALPFGRSSAFAARAGAAHHRLPRNSRPMTRPRQPGFAQQLPHETREAAGEEEKDDKPQFKQSPSVHSSRASQA